MTHSDKQNNLFAHAQLQNSVYKAKNTKRNITQKSKETNRWSFNDSLLDVWVTILSCNKYVLFNTFSKKNINYCSVAFSLLFSILCGFEYIYVILWVGVINSLLFYYPCHAVG